MAFQQVPSTIFHTRQKDSEGNFQWVDVHTDEIFKGKRVIVFALPGAFTPTCTSKHLPRYEELYDELVPKYCDEIYCLSVNDTFVMNAWFKQLGIQKVKPIPDGNLWFTEGLIDETTWETWEGDDLSFRPSMTRNYLNLGFGFRSHRYSMYVDDGVILKMFSEDRTKDGDPYEVSDAETMLRWCLGVKDELS